MFSLLMPFFATAYLILDTPNWWDILFTPPVESHTPTQSRSGPAIPLNGPKDVSPSVSIRLEGSDDRELSPTDESTLSGGLMSPSPPSPPFTSTGHLIVDSPFDRVPPTDSNTAGSPISDTRQSEPGPSTSQNRFPEALEGDKSVGLHEREKSDLQADDDEQNDVEKPKGSSDSDFTNIGSSASSPASGPEKVEVPPGKLSAPPTSDGSIQKIVPWESESHKDAQPRKREDTLQWEAETASDASKDRGRIRTRSWTSPQRRSTVSLSGSREFLKPANSAERLSTSLVRSSSVRLPLTGDNAIRSTNSIDILFTESLSRATSQKKISQDQQQQPSLCQSPTQSQAAQIFEKLSLDRCSRDSLQISTVDTSVSNPASGPEKVEVPPRKLSAPPTCNGSIQKIVPWESEFHKDAQPCKREDTLQWEAETASDPSEGRGRVRTRSRTSSQRRSTVSLSGSRESLKPANSAEQLPTVSFRSSSVRLSLTGGDNALQSTRSNDKSFTTESLSRATPQNKFSQDQQQLSRTSTQSKPTKSLEKLSLDSLSRHPSQIKLSKSNEMISNNLHRDTSPPSQMKPSRSIEKFSSLSLSRASSLRRSNKIVPVVTGPDVQAAEQQTNDQPSVPTSGVLPPIKEYVQRTSSAIAKPPQTRLMGSTATLAAPDAAAYTSTASLAAKTTTGASSIEVIKRELLSFVEATGCLDVSQLHRNIYPSNSVWKKFWRKHKFRPKAPDIYGDQKARMKQLSHPRFYGSSIEELMAPCHAGLPLEAVTPEMLPTHMYQLCEWLRAGDPPGIATEGLFRRPVHKNTLDKFRNVVEGGGELHYTPTPNPNRTPPPHAAHIGGLLKEWFRNLKEPLLMS
ncbi:hypothetical protein DFS34DRAFT_589193 [Phlyctochytrium arcticum]|nr:hypothetical protein DFS34DRAFT_589193 [Phlyctochytrium arcticum]